MKRLLSFLLVLSLSLSLASIAFAAPDDPFKPGINYSEAFHENSAMPSMLNFGYAKLSPGESLYDAKTNTLKSVKVSQMDKDLEEGKKTFYCYAKWQCGEGFSDYTIDAMLVITTPDGDYYATYSTWEIDEGRARWVYSWFFDTTELLNRIKTDNNGSMPKGEYSFSLFFNDMSFRIAKVKFK